MSRRNLRDHFEAMYLRYNMASKYMRKADQTILQDTQFKKVVAYMAGVYFNRYRHLLVNHGFEYEDVHSIVTVFGLTYWGHSSPPERNKTAFMFMMRYVGQRMQTFVRWVSRKFSADEVQVMTSGNFQFLSDQSIFDAGIHEETEPDDQDYLIEEIAALEKILVDDEVPDRYVKRTLKTSKKILTAQQKIRLQERKEQDALTKDLKSRLEADPKAYSEQLCYYATSKHVGKDVRNRARVMCRRYGIDYVQWLKDKSLKLDFDSNQFTI